VLSHILYHLFYPIFRYFYGIRTDDKTQPKDDKTDVKDDKTKRVYIALYRRFCGVICPFIYPYIGFCMFYYSMGVYTKRKGSIFCYPILYCLYCIIYFFFLCDRFAAVRVCFFLYFVGNATLYFCIPSINSFLGMPAYLCNNSIYLPTNLLSW
jgi:hypothetical protein